MTGAETGASSTSATGSAVADAVAGAGSATAGAGSGALSIAILRAIGKEGSLVSYEKRDEFADIARKNVEKYFGNIPPSWSLQTGDLGEIERDRSFTKVVLDMLSPWDFVNVVSEVLLPGGVFLAYVATTTQLSQIAEAIKISGDFTEPESCEIIVRGWHHEGLAVRPQHRMIGHTAFLITARRFSPGVKAPMRRRRPSKGAYGLSVSEE